ncbi:MAG: alanine racemase [Firmicutes bacterium]|nr:alanine racemase [Bacillota bacterium]
MYKSAMRPAWVEINLAALDHNIKQIRSKIGESKKIIGVVKADAYGHGAFNVADVLKDNGVNSFAVATIPEAVALRKYFDENRDFFDDYGYEFDESMLSDDENFFIGDTPEVVIPEPEQEEILVLGLIPDMFADVVVEYDLTPVVCDYNNARTFSEVAGSMGKMVSVLIALDTGMGRIGYVIPDEAVSGADCDCENSSSDCTNALAPIIEEVRKISELPDIKISGIISHMSTADEEDKTYANSQNEKYKAFVKALERSGIFAPRCNTALGVTEPFDTPYQNDDISKLPSFPFLTLANSAGIMELEATYFDAVRPGIILYGCYPSDEVDSSILDLEPVMSVKATIKHIKDVPCGFSVGYGRKFISDRPSRIATLGIGYADGYPRRFSTMEREPLNDTSDFGDASTLADNLSCEKGCQTPKPLPCVIVNGRYAPLAGKICMDQVMIDVTDIPDAKIGDEVIIMGSMPAEANSADNCTKTISITADDIAGAIGTINYEVLCGFALRLPRIYKYFK